MNILKEEKFKYLICPKCKKKLEIHQNALKCAAGHSYDISAEGYVNLLPPHKKGGVPGDNAEMIKARREFLAKGYYQSLADRLISVINRYSPSVIVDVGCGEGYYTSKMSSFGAYVTGFDISKYAAATAAKLDKTSDYCVANLHELPIGDAVADMTVCCFCAYDENEFFRILKPNGKFVLVVPAKRHLFGLKSALYDAPYENTEDIADLAGFELCAVERVSDAVDITNKQDIWNLFSMTPYFWKSSKQGAQRLSDLQNLHTEIEFLVLVYQKNQSAKQL